MVKLLGIEHTKREMIYLFLLLITVGGMFLITAVAEKERVAYHNVLVECLNSLSYAEDGYLPTFNNLFINQTINYTEKK